MTANVTELWRIVESLRLELASLRTNFTLSDIDVLATAVQVDSMGTDMDSFWLMLGSMLVVCELLELLLRMFCSARVRIMSCHWNVAVDT